MGRTRILVEGYQDRVAVISGRVLFEFFPTGGLYSLAFGDQFHALDRVLISFHTPTGVVDSLSYPEIRWKIVDISDKLGEGKAFVAHFGAKPELPALTAEFSFYERRQLVAVEVQVANTTGHPLVLREVLPICSSEKGASLTFGEISDCKVLRGNWACSDNEPALYSLGRDDGVDSPNSMLLYDKSGGVALACGICEPARCETSFHVSTTEGNGRAARFDVRQRPVLGNAADKTGIVLREGQSFSAGRIVLAFGDGPHKALEAYAESVRRANNIPRIDRIPCGWCFRPHTHRGAAERQVLSHAEFIAEEFKRYGLQDILIDAGWQISGDFSGGPWRPGASFPSGMKSLAEKAHARGLKIGLWLRPFDFESVRLDPSGEFAKNLLQKEAAKISQEWGFDFIKVDFVDWDAFGREDRYLPENNSVTTNEAVRAAFEAMKSGLRPGTFLLGLESAFPALLGVIEAAGIVRDVDATRWQTVRESALKAAALRYHLHNAFWVNDPGYLAICKPATLFQARALASLIALSGGCVFASDSLVSLGKTKKSIIRKIIPPFGKAARPVDLMERESPQTWVLEVEKPFGKWRVVGLFNWDPTPKEVVEGYRQAVQSNIAILRENDKNEGIERSASLHRRTAADNRLLKKENERIASLLQASGIAKPKLQFLKPVRRMRKSPRLRNLTVTFRELGLDEAVPYLVYDFWSEAFLGEHRGSLTALVKLAGCRALAVHKRLDHPQLLSTNRHLTQGGIELHDLRWVEKRAALRGKSDVVAGDDYCVTLHVPGNYKFAEMKADCDEFTADTSSPHLVRLRLKNQKDKQVTWRAKFEKIH